MKQIKFDNCYDCPFSSTGSGLGILCPEPLINPKMWRLMWKGEGKKEDCPFDKGIIVKDCRGCPYVDINGSEWRCPKIRPRSSVRVNPDKIHPECKLDEAT